MRTKALKFSEYAARGERCPWCKNLKRGRCSGCGQEYGERGDTTGSTARRVTQKAEALPGSAPPGEVAAPSQPNAPIEASARTIAQPVVLLLPEPPSANRWWRRHGTTMHLSREAKAYKEAVLLRVRELCYQTYNTGLPFYRDGVAFPAESLTVVIVWRRDRKSGDLDKRLGVLLDALQGSVYANDAQIVQLWARRCDEHPELAPGTVRVEVSATT